MRRCLLVLSFLLVAVTAPLAGQNQVTGIRDLDFGVVIRGVQTAIAPSDPIYSGRFYVNYRRNRDVQLQFILPTSLARVAGGGSLAISFGPADAIAQGTSKPSQPVVFDPNVPQLMHLQTSGDFYINLGGRVSPTAVQPSGAYSGTIILNVVFL